VLTAQGPATSKRCSTLVPEDVVVVVVVVGGGVVVVGDGVVVVVVGGGAGWHSGPQNSGGTHWHQNGGDA
jgi:hypothetical protein